MKSKTPHPIKKRSSLSKNMICPIIPDHIERLRFFNAAMNERKALELSNEMIEWGDVNQDALFENQFLVLKKISQQTWGLWKKKYECLQEASDHLKTVLAVRREQLAIEKDQKFLSNSMHLYSKLFEDDKTLEHERKKELKNIDVKKNDLPSIIAAINATMAPLDIDQKKQLPSEKDNDEG